MIMVFAPIMLNNLNSIHAPPLISTGVEVTGVFITADSSPNFASPHPKR
jgi:hypothetical protein